MENLKGKCVLLCVTGGIAAYKIPNVASALRKAGAEVHVIMTQNATQFITPLTFETLTNNRCVVDTFARDFQYDVTHISLAQAADLILIAPATADVIAKLAHGIADDMLTTVVLAAKCKKLVSPAMNTAMLENPITQDNIATLKKYGFEIIPPASGLLACQAVGARMVKAGKGGSIINVGSIYGMLSPIQDIYAYKKEMTGVPFIKPVAYSAAKSGIYNLTRYLATYWGKKGIRVNTLTPAGVWRDTQDEIFQANFCARMPMGRMSQENEYNGALIFLASQASSFMTGSNLVIDGGWTAW